MNKDLSLTFYYPELYSDDGTNIDYSSPEELLSGQGFETREVCQSYMENMGYEDGTYIIHESELTEEELEDFTFIDEDGKPYNIGE